jgi:homeobox protein cut-like
LHVSLPSPDVSNTTPKKGKTKEHSVATIVIVQRDKLRKRCDVLEAERGGLKKELQMQVSMADSLKSDNTKLYEKVRYLQSYNNSNNSSRFYNGKSNAHMNDIDIKALDQEYEASVDPFRQFSRSER